MKAHSFLTRSAIASVLLNAALQISYGQTESPTQPATQKKPTDKQRVQLENLCGQGRYLEEGEIQETSSFANWEDFARDTKLHINKAKSKWAKEAKLPVVLLDPTNERAARWVISAIQAKYGRYDHDKALRFASYISAQSQFQFPIAGFVEEGDNINIFRDGIAVTVQGLANLGQSDSLHPRALVHSLRFTELGCDKALHAPEKDIGLEGFQARPSSIRVEELHQNKCMYGDDATPWNRAELRETYQKAFYKDEMPLITNLLLMCGDELLHLEKDKTDDAYKIYKTAFRER